LLTSYRETVQSAEIISLIGLSDSWSNLSGNSHSRTHRASNKDRATRKPISDLPLQICLRRYKMAIASTQIQNDVVVAPCMRVIILIS